MDEARGGFENGGQLTNVPGNNVEGALSCIGPQGINGCGYEAPLEAMLQAINPGAAFGLLGDGGRALPLLLGAAMVGYVGWLAYETMGHA